ncbi:type II secretion system protein N [Luteimonas sp. e5]
MLPRLPVSDALARHRPARLLPGALLATLLALLAWQGARLAWMLLLAPAPVQASAGTATPRGGSPQVVHFAAVGDPFFATAAANAPSGAGSVSGLQLYAVRLSPAPASAILQAGNGAQASVLLGERLENGLQLAEVAADHVLLRDGAGALHRVALHSADPSPAAASMSAPAQLPQSAPAPGGAADVSAAALAQASLVPEMEQGRLRGYRIAARGDAPLLRQAGIEPGDLLTAIDGNPLTAETLAEWQQGVASGGASTLTIIRDGQTRTLRLQGTHP